VSIRLVYMSASRPCPDGRFSVEVGNDHPAVARTELPAKDLPSGKQLAQSSWRDGTILPVIGGETGGWRLTGLAHAAVGFSRKKYLGFSIWPKFQARAVAGHECGQR